MTGWVSVGKVGDFRDDIVRSFPVDGVEVGVVRREGRYYAFAGRCTHEHYSFNYTRIRPGDVIICSSHFAFFELQTGHVLNGPGLLDLALYSVRLDGDDILVSLEPPPAP